MKKVWGWIVGVVLVIVLGYVIWSSSSAAPMATNTNPDDGTAGAGTGANGTGAMGNMPGMNMSSTASGTMAMPMGNTTGTSSSAGSGYKDGIYTGATANAVYGQLQVAVTISGGQITDVTFPVYPNNPGHTSQVSASALPALKQEAIVSQSANVAIVSGATQDSQAFQESLASALAMAKN